MDCLISILPFHRVESRNGTIVDHFGGGNYTANRACLFFIEAGW